MNQYIGQLLDDRYELLEVIGTGGMAVVYKARCHRLNRLVAVKVLKDEFSGDEEFRRRFRAEGEAVAMLSHPNIVQVHRVFDANATAYMIMDFERGPSVEKWLGGLERTPTQDEIDQLVGPRLDALALMHAKDFLHRDIAPDNIIMRPD